MNDITRCPLVTRRSFVRGLGASVLLTACGGRTLTVLTSTSTTSAVAPGTFGDPTERVLVIIELGGGNDGLNTVIPHADPAYHDLRPSIRIEDGIDLDGELALHPNLTSLAERYSTGQVAIIEGVGVENPDLSHFVSMNTWWTAQPDSADATGWLGRYLDGTVGYDDPLAGITIGPGPSRALLGDSSFAVAIADGSGLAPNVAPWIDSVDELIGAWQGFAVEDPNRIELAPVQRAIASTVEARSTLQAALDGYGRTQRRRTVLSDQLDLAARLITSGVAPTILYIHGFGDFDTHEGQLNRHGQMMGELDSAIDSFFTALDEAGMGDRAIILTASEFGRRPRDNGGGTDHGTAAAHILIGSAVAGGRYGESPSLSRLDRTANLIHAVDFRSVYATVLDGWLGADADAVLGATFERLPIF